MLTNNVDVAHVGEHGIGVDLAHVVALVLLLYVADVQVPCVVLVVSDLEPGDAGDDVVVDRQDHLTLKVDKGDLKIEFPVDDLYFRSGLPLTL